MKDVITSPRQSTETVPAARKPWLRFTFRLNQPGEFGLFGRILCGLCGDCRAFHYEPWPGDDCALYLKNEGDAKERLFELAKQAGLRPIAAAEVDTCL